MEIKEEKGYRIADIQAVSGTILLEQKKSNRVFQKKVQTYMGIASTVTADTEHSACILPEGIILEKLSYQFANWNRGQAENKMTQLINRYGTEIELVISNNDEMALGAAAAYDALGYLQDSRPVILGIDGLDSALEAVKKGYIQGTVYNDKEGQASRISGLALDLFRGKVLPDSDFENGRYIFLPYHKVTADNVDEFLK